MLNKVILAGVIAALFGTIPFPSMAQQEAIVITQPPPPPRGEPMPQARRGHEWAPGHWAWRNGAHVWVPGHWVLERPGEHWVADRWVQRDGRWIFLAGHWVRGGRDRDRDNDGVRNRNDRDRDGDGVRNRRDNRPNNPNRN